MFPGALHQIQIDEVLIWSARLLGHVFEVFDRLPREVHGHRPAGRNGIGVRLASLKSYSSRVLTSFSCILPALAAGGLHTGYFFHLQHVDTLLRLMQHSIFTPFIIHKALPANTCERYFVCVAGRAVTAWHFADFLWIVLACCQVHVVLAHDFVEVLFDEVLWACFPL